MELWIFFLIVSVLFLVLEMFTPVLFFINLSIAAAISALCAYLGLSLTAVILIFLVTSIAAIGLIRPLLLKNMRNKSNDTGIEDKYIGKNAKVVEDVTKSGGRIAIYGEEWQAKLALSDTNEVISAGNEVKIISNESIVFTVEKI